MKNEFGRNIRLGIFVVLGVLLFTVGIYVIGQQQNMFSSSFRIVSVFQNVNGLRTGSNVRYLGIDVGTVKKVTVNTDTTILVEMTVSKEVRGRLRKNAIASIGSEGLMGDIVINILPGPDLSAPYIQPLDTLASLTPINTEDIVRTFSITNKNAAEISMQMNKMFQSINKGKGILGAILNDTVMKANLSRIVSNFRTVSASTKDLTADLTRFSRQLQQEGTIGHELTDTGFSKNLKKALEDLQNASSQSAIATKQLMQFSQDLNNKNGLASKLLNDSTLANEFETALHNVREGAQNLNKSMKALSNSFLFRRPFRKVEAEEKKCKP